jgi:ATP-dependent helicase/nuclease subunit A
MLTEDPEWANILYAFDEKTDHILVDEFQDTNTFQWEIINKLTEEWRSGMGAKREEGVRPTVFFVGDEKQSIYYFRGANVEIFSRAREKLEDWLGEEFCYEEVTDNYRSLPAVIEFTNHVFSRVMLTGERPFPWKTKYTKFNANRSAEPQNGRVEIILLDNEDDTTAEAKQKEAEVLALRIKGLAGSYKVTDRSTRHQRPCRYMDMAVLLRKRTHLKSYEDALKKHNIPFVAVKGIGFYQEPEVAMLRALVFFLSDPGDDYSLYVLLKSPLFQINESSIIELINSEGTGLFSKLQELMNEPAQPDGPDTDQLQAAALLIKEWISLLPHTPLAELIEEILVRTKAWAHYHEEQSKANVKKFIRIVEDLESAGKSLIKIRDFLERTLDKSDEAKANVNTEGMDAVKIMTVHAAKGLEFPLVFFPGLEEPFGMSPGENLVYEKNGEFFFKSEPESSIRKQDEDFQVHQAKEEEEQKRLFYVAVTRAEEALFLLGRWSSRDNNFLAFLKHGAGLEKSGDSYYIDPDVPGLSVLTEEDVKALYKDIPVHEAAKKAVHPVSVTPLTVQRQAPWKAVTETVEIKRQHGKDWAVLGDIIHRIFEGVSKGTIQEQDIRGRSEKMLESRGFRRDEREEKIDIIEKDIETLREKGIWQEIILPGKDSYSELPFILQDEEAVYTGRIDRIVKDREIYNIYDYKTFPVKEKEIEYLLKKYSVQLNVYRKAVKNLFNADNVRSFIIFTHTGDVKEV